MSRAVLSAWGVHQFAPGLYAERLDPKPVSYTHLDVYKRQGLACAQQLARAGHAVVVFEKNDRIGGLLRYGIPDFKLETWLIDRRLAQLRAEGVEFRPNSHVGAEIPARALLAEFDALVLSGGAEHPRDLSGPGRELRGIQMCIRDRTWALAHPFRYLCHNGEINTCLLYTSRCV